MQSVDATSSSETSYMMAGKTAARFLLDCMAAGGHVPAALRNSQRRSDADYVLSWLLKMATAAEKAVMQVQGPERDENAAQAIACEVARLVRKRIHEGGQTGKRFLNGALTANAVLEQGKRSGVAPDAGAFAAWRDPAQQTAVQQQRIESALGKRDGAPPPSLLPSPPHCARACSQIPPHQQQQARHRARARAR